MNIKRIWLIVPSLLLPYLGIGMVFLVWNSAEVPFCSYLMETFFQGNGLNVLWFVLGYCVLAAALSAVCLGVSIRKGWDSLSLAKSAMIIKLLQIPAYVVSFILGVLCLLSVFLLPVAVGFFILNCLSVLLTGLLVIAAVTNAERKELISRGAAAWLILLQFLFCADVVASIVLYCKLRKAYRTQS